MTVSVFTIVLIVGTLATALVTGLVFTFALITMPGIRVLDDREFVRAFQVMDRIIQNNHPLFIAVWLGSVLSLVIASILGIASLTATPRLVLIVATIIYIGGVQIPTIAINVPLNNALQRVDTRTTSDPVVQQARRAFESRWNRWNLGRTIVGVLVTTALIVVLQL